MTTSSDRDGDAPLARRLWAAKCERGPRVPASGGQLPRERGNDVAAEVYGRLAQGGARQVGAKIGMTDPGAQEALGAAGPFRAPVWDVGVLRPGGQVGLDELYRPRLEIEIAFVWSGDGEVHVRPCFEIIDTRFDPGPSCIGEVVADFGLQQWMCVGDRGVPLSAVGDEVSCVVSHDGERQIDTVTSIRRAWDTVRDMECADGRPGPWFVASGSITEPLALQPGRWEGRFGWGTGVWVDVVGATGPAP